MLSSVYVKDYTDMNTITNSSDNDKENANTNIQSVNYYPRKS
jgi:hypothetical protein